MAKKSDPVLNPDPTWIKSFGSDRIKIHNIGSNNFLFFQVCTDCTHALHSYPFQNFPFLPTLSTSLKTSYFAARRKTLIQAQVYWYCSFYRKLFYCTIFYLSFLVYASFSVVIYRKHCFFTSRIMRAL